jgi:hypothetical protein
VFAWTFLLPFSALLISIEVFVVVDSERMHFYKSFRVHFSGAQAKTVSSSSWDWVLHIWLLSSHPALFGDESCTLFSGICIVNCGVICVTNGWTKILDSGLSSLALDINVSRVTQLCMCLKESTRLLKFLWEKNQRRNIAQFNQSDFEHIIIRDNHILLTNDNKATVYISITYK